MSDDTTTKSTPAKTAPVKKTPAKTETASPKTGSSSADSASTSASNGGADTGTTSAPAEKATSGKAAMGGAGEVHYGFFSNVKNPQYRSGWDSIWSKGKNKGEEPAKAEVKKKRPVRSKEPVTVSLSIEELPDDLREALAEIVRARLKGSRISYDRRAKAGAVSWNIDCEVRR
jgi:hypothetical protein